MRQRNKKRDAVEWLYAGCSWPPRAPALAFGRIHGTKIPFVITSVFFSGSYAKHGFQAISK